LIYIPVFNCRDRVIPLIDEIRADIWEIADVLVIDNCSTDGSLAALREANEKDRWLGKVTLIQATSNVGYSGSQKLAYRLAIENGGYDWVMMLHGDGQYDPSLMPAFFEHCDSPCDVVHGYRSWRTYWGRDETPFSSYITIKVLSFAESLITGYWRKEWHSGIVMYRTSFLARVNFDNITPTMHIDGHLLYAAGVLNAAVLGLPIYKRYKNYEAIGHTARVRYVLDVLRLMPKLRSIPVERDVTSIVSPAPAFATFPPATGVVES
jgi:glycosyltransferase involved in cell wall biosynthesis